jgi:hypothetical protein
MRRADASFSSTPTWSAVAPEWTSFIPVAWLDLRPQLDQLIDRLQVWLVARKKAPRAKGQRQEDEDRFQLRIRIFQALQKHGVAIKSNGQNGNAARVLAIVLAEADRVDGKPSRDRVEFNGHQWKGWLSEHKLVDACLAFYEKDGVLRDPTIDLLSFEMVKKYTNQKGL